MSFSSCTLSIGILLKILIHGYYNDTPLTFAVLLTCTFQILLIPFVNRVIEQIIVTLFYLVMTEYGSVYLIT